MIFIGRKILAAGEREQRRMQIVDCRIWNGNQMPPRRKKACTL
jgi:hypothetical protein